VKLASESGMSVPDLGAEAWLFVAHESISDGFALSVGGDAHTTKQVTNAFHAAYTTNPDFKLFFSFDMSNIPCATAADADFILDLARNFTQKPNYLHLRGVPYVTTFSGERCNFGVEGDSLDDNAVLNAVWQQGFKDQLDFPVHFAPGFLINPARYMLVPPSWVIARGAGLI
jgi:glucan endo-1,3-alpha-glucosidase